MEIGIQHLDVSGGVDPRLVIGRNYVDPVAVVVPRLDVTDLQVVNVAVEPEAQSPLPSRGPDTGPLSVVDLDALYSDVADGARFATVQHILGTTGQDRQDGSPEPRNVARILTARIKLIRGAAVLR